MLWDKNKVDVDRGRGLAHAERQRQGRRDDVYEARRSSSPPARSRCRSPGSSSATASSTPGAPGRCPSSRRRSPSSAPAPPAREIASAYGRFGTEVLLIEMLDQILPAEDKDMARVVERAFKKQNITISTGTPVENVEAGKDSVKFTYGDETAEVDYLCIAGGRAPDTEALGLDEAGVETRGERQGQGRRVPADLEPEGLRDRRPGPRQGARPQGLRGGRRRGRARSPAPRPTRSTRTSSPAPPSATRRWRASA